MKNILIVALSVLVLSCTAVFAGDFKVNYSADLGYLIEDFDLSKTDSNTMDAFASVNRDYSLETSVALTFKDLVKVGGHFDAIENTNQDRYVRVDLMPSGLFKLGSHNFGVWARYGEFRNKVGSSYTADYAMVGLNVNGIFEF